MSNICFECRKNLGYKPKHNGATTAAKLKYEECKEVKFITPERHWKIKEANNE